VSKPYIHAQSSVKRWGGRVEDYLPIHQLMDSSKGAFPDNRHRCLTHTSWFLSVILERVFGVTITNSDGKEVSVRDVGEQHVTEDFGGVIPTVQDFLAEMEYKNWMHAKGKPPSHRKIEEKQVASKVSVREILWD
jgi:hypothetical protein